VSVSTHLHAAESHVPGVQSMHEDHLYMSMSRTLIRIREPQAEHSDRNRDIR